MLLPAHFFGASMPMDEDNNKYACSGYKPPLTTPFSHDLVQQQICPNTRESGKITG